MGKTLIKIEDCTEEKFDTVLKKIIQREGVQLIHFQFVIMPGREESFAYIFFEGDYTGLSYECEDLEIEIKTIA